MDERDKKQFVIDARPAGKEAAAKSRAGEELPWSKVASKTFCVDLETLTPAQSEPVVASVVCAGENAGLTLRMNGNDQGKA